MSIELQVVKLLTKEQLEKLGHKVTTIDGDKADPRSFTVVDHKSGTRLVFQNEQQVVVYDKTKHAPLDSKTVERFADIFVDQAELDEMADDLIKGHA